MVEHTTLRRKVCLNIFLEILGETKGPTSGIFVTKQLLLGPQESMGMVFWGLPSLKLTAILPLQMDGWNTSLSYWVSAYFHGLC